MQDDRIDISSFIALVDKLFEILQLKQTLVRVEEKLDAVLAGHMTPEQQAKLDEIKAKLDANDAAVAAALKDKQ